MPTRTSAPLLALLALGSVLLLAAGPATSTLTDVVTDAPGTVPAQGPERAPGLGQSPGESAEEGTVTSARASESLVGVFEIDPAECADGGVTEGSYFRMVTAFGSPDAGPYVSNTDSPCGDDTYTPLRPGSDGGLTTGAHQPHPEPAFSGGDGTASRITQPQAFLGNRFSTATNPTDPQTGTDVPAPSVAAGGGTLDGDVRAFAAAWNGQHFNQGAPKPDGSRPGNTTGPTGTYDPATGRYTLEWSSQIVGGPFNGFTGVWHLEGTFRAQDATAGTTGTQTTDDAKDARADGSTQESGQADEQASAEVADRGTERSTATGGAADQPDDASSERTGDLPRTGPAAPAALAPVLLGAGVLLSRRRAARR